MIFVILVCVTAWARNRGSRRTRSLLVIFAGFVAAGMSVFVSALPFFVYSYPVSSNITIRVFGGLTTFPFTMQQYRDYDQHLFYYQIVIGWPDGISVYTEAFLDNQSEFILGSHGLTTFILGLYALFSIPLSAPIILALENYEKSEKQKRITWTKGSPVNYLKRLTIPIIIFTLGVILALGIISVSRPTGLEFLFAWGLFLPFCGWALFVCLAMAPASLNSTNQKDEPT